ncbi:MAG: hypothetical protein ACREB0_13270 [Sphingopyxis sp.]
MFEGRSSKKIEGRSWSKREVVAGRLAEDGVDFVAVGVEGTPKARRDAADRASATADGRVVGGCLVAVEERVFGDKGEIEGRQSGGDEVDDDDLGSGDETTEFVEGHRFRADAVLGFGV